MRVRPVVEKGEWVSRAADIFPRMGRPVKAFTALAKKDRLFGNN